MSNNKLRQLIANGNFIRQCVDPQLQTVIKNNFNFQSWFSCASRTLTSALNHIWCYSSHSNASQLLYGMCGLLKNNPQLNIYPNYLTINTEEAAELETNFNTILRYPNISTQKFNIVLYHIPKGKSFLKPILDRTYDDLRLRQIETYGINNTQHFLRIYKNFNSSGENTITIFSDQYSEEFMYILWTMLPHLMQIRMHETDEITPEIEAHNKRTQLLYQIFEVFFNALNDPSTQEYTPDELNTLKNKLQKLTKEYTAQFDFITNAVNTFTKNLAQAKNKITSTYYERELNTLNRHIQAYEDDLVQSYTKKLHLERQISAARLISEEDIKPFTETLLNAKAIEVLNTNSEEMVIRITAPLQYFQESDFETYENNPNSMYNGYFRNNPIIQKVLHKIFVTREYKLLAQAIIHMKITSNYTDMPLTFYAEKLHAAPTLTQFPNPHLYHYDCWGAAKNEMSKNICEGNYELVIMQMIAAVQSVNIAENASFVNGFLSDIKNSSTLRKLITIIKDTPEGPKQHTFEEICALEQVLEQQNKAQQIEQALSAKTQAAPNQYVQIELPDEDDTE